MPIDILLELEDCVVGRGVRAPFVMTESLGRGFDFPLNSREGDVVEAAMSPCCSFTVGVSSSMVITLLAVFLPSLFFTTADGVPLLGDSTRAASPMIDFLFFVAVPSAVDGVTEDGLAVLGVFTCFLLREIGVAVPFWVLLAQDAQGLHAHSAY